MSAPVQLELCAASGGWVISGGDMNEFGTSLRVVTHGGRRWEIFIAIGLNEDGEPHAEVAKVTEVTE